MSGIYIGGVDLPKGGVELRLIVRENGLVFVDCFGVWKETRAISVPDHGRLIDAGMLVPDTSFFDGGDWHYGYSARQIECAPTIIPEAKEERE